MHELPICIALTHACTCIRDEPMNACTKVTRICEYMHYCLQWLEVVAPTGIAARNVDGETIHSVFSLPIRYRRNQSTLAGDLGMEDNWHVDAEVSALAVHTASESHALSLTNMRYVFCDEVSMVGQQDLWNWNVKMNERFPAKEGKPPEWFGGKHMITAGDFKQLGAIAKDSLWVQHKAEREYHTVGDIIEHTLQTVRQEKPARRTRKKTSPQQATSTTA
jgi:hypothetical protein